MRLFAGPCHHSVHGDRCAFLSVRLGLRELGNSFFSGSVQLIRRTGQAGVIASTALVPPKAKELLIAARTLRSRAVLGVTSRSHSGSFSR